MYWYLEFPFWSEWTAGSCSKTCGSGVMIERRTCRKKDLVSGRTYSISIQDCMAEFVDTRSERTTVCNEPVCGKSHVRIRLPISTFFSDPDTDGTVPPMYWYLVTLQYMRSYAGRWIWDDSGSGADEDGSFWKISDTTGDFYPVGDAICNGHRSCKNLIRVKDVSSDHILTQEGFDN